MKRSIRMTAAIVLSAVLFLTAAFADAYIIDHVRHDCTGEDCPVCAGLHAAENALLAISSAVISAALFLFCSVKAEDESCHELRLLISNSLVTLKVRMDD